MGKVYKPKNRKRRVTHGFLIRSRKPGGRRVLRRRRRKQRSQLTP